MVWAGAEAETVDVPDEVGSVVVVVRLEAGVVEKVGGVVPEGVSEEVGVLEDGAEVEDAVAAQVAVVGRASAAPTEPQMALANWMVATSDRQLLQWCSGERKHVPSCPAASHAWETQHAKSAIQAPKTRYYKTSRRNLCTLITSSANTFDVQGLASAVIGGHTAVRCA